MRFVRRRERKQGTLPPPTTHVFVISLSTTPSKTGLWRDHAAKCKGIVHQAERRQLSAYVGAGGEAHRQKLVDTYMISYFAYKERMAFTIGEQLKKVDSKCLLPPHSLHPTHPRRSFTTCVQVLPHLYCVDAAKASKLPLFNDSVARYWLCISESLIARTRQKMKNMIAYPPPPPSPDYFSYPCTVCFNT
jgi:hypothetical protein